MNPRIRFWILVGLAGAVIGAAIYFPFLRRRVKVATQTPQQTEEQARRELTQSLTQGGSAAPVKAAMFWLSDSKSELAQSNIELPLSGDPILRSKQVLNTLLAGPAKAELRTLPPEAELLEFYLLPDGKAVADFSESLTTSIPAGIQSEQLAVDSITQTLKANVAEIRTLKILIHGQEVDTLAGHVDLTQAFAVNVAPEAMPAAKTQEEKSAAPAPTPAPVSKPAANPVAPQKKPAEKFIPQDMPSKPAQPARQP